MQTNYHWGLAPEALFDLGCVVFGDIGFRTVFAAFRSGHDDNLFPFIVV